MKLHNQVNLIGKVKKLLHQDEFKKIAGNTWWLLFDKLFRLIISAVVTILIARYLGPNDFGILNYCLAFVGFFAPFMTLGLNHIITRDIVNREDANVVLGTTFILRTSSGILCIILSYLIILFIRPDEYVIHLYIIILSVGQSLKSFSVIDYWFQSRYESKYVSISRSAALVLVSLSKLLLIYVESGLIYFIVIYSIEFALSELILLAPYLRKKHSLFRWKFDSQDAIQYVKSVWPLVLSGFAAVLYLKVDKIMLGEMISDESVGIYSAAAQLSEAWYAIPVALSAGVFPKLLKDRKDNLDTYYQNIEKLLNFLVILALIICIPLTFFSDLLIGILYGESYIAAGPVLSIHIWASIFIFMRAVLSKWILAEDLLKFSLISQLSGAVVNIVLNFILIPVYAEIGAAVTTLVSYAFASYFCLFFFKDTEKISAVMTRSLFFPIRYFFKK